jgi:hypothetical protein
MQFAKALLFCCTLVLLVSAAMNAQQAVPSPTTAVVPRLVNFSGKTINNEGKSIAGIAGITFSIYKDQYEGAPLWMETQNVTADTRGNYTVQLGATSAEGLPLDLFTSGEARWLGVRMNGGEEQPRVLLLSVPYALKAADAQTLAGLPASAFVLAAPPLAAAIGNTAAAVSNAGSPSAAVSGSGTTDYLPLWTNSTGALGNSVLFQSGTGSTAKVGINTTTPAVTLDVNGAEDVRGMLNLTSTGTATATAGKNSQPLDFTASAYNSGSKAAVVQKFQWQAEPVGNDTASAAGALSLLFGAGSATPAETGLKIAKSGVITFASGQTFPGGAGTVTSVGLSAPTSDFTVSGSPITASGNLGLAWKVAPTSADTANAIVKRDATGSFNATSVRAVVSSGNAGILGYDQSSGGSDGVSGLSNNGIGTSGTSNAGYGVYGITGNSNTAGVYGLGPGFGVYGSGSTGVAGISTGNYIGVYGNSSGSGTYGVFGLDSSARMMPTGTMQST